MRRVWATVGGVWAVLAIVGVLAWTRGQAPAPSPQAAQTMRVVKGKNGIRQLLAQPAAARHATTQTSPTQAASDG